MGVRLIIRIVQANARPATVTTAAIVLPSAYRVMRLVRQSFLIVPVSVRNGSAIPAILNPEVCALRMIHATAERIRAVRMVARPTGVIVQANVRFAIRTTAETERRSVCRVMQVVRIIIPIVLQNVLRGHVIRVI